jgi:hypothetical protein
MYFWYLVVIAHFGKINQKNLVLLNSNKTKFFLNEQKHQQKKRKIKGCILLFFFFFNKKG